MGRRRLACTLGSMRSHCKVSGVEVRWSDLCWREVAGCGLGWRTGQRESSKTVEAAGELVRLMAGPRAPIRKGVWRENQQDFGRGELVWCPEYFSLVSRLTQRRWRPSSCLLQAWPKAAPHIPLPPGYSHQGSSGSHPSQPCHGKGDHFWPWKASSQTHSFGRPEAMAT